MKKNENAMTAVIRNMSRILGLQGAPIARHHLRFHTMSRVRGSSPRHTSKMTRGACNCRSRFGSAAGHVSGAAMETLATIPPMQSPADVVSRNTFGQVSRAYAFDGVTVEEVTMRPGLRVPTHTHEHAQIYFILEGHYAETIGDAQHVLGPGQTWFRPALEPHANAVVGDGAALTLIITVDDRRLQSISKTLPPACRLQAGMIDDLRGEIVREITAGDDGSITALEGWTLLLLSRTERMLIHGSHVPAWYAAALDFIRTRYREDISLETVSKHVGRHPATISAAFRRFRATSVGAFIRETRLQFARDELLRSRRPIRQIAMDAGFYDHAHFCRWFRRRFGISPIAVRANSSH